MVSEFVRSNASRRNVVMQVGVIKCAVQLHGQSNGHSVDNAM